MAISKRLRQLLLAWADRYETADFLVGDPSWFMHQVCGEKNQEVMAFIASSLSYGNRKAFLSKIQLLLDASAHEPYRWVLKGGYRDILPDDGSCFYRLYTHHAMRIFLDALREMLENGGSIKAFVNNGNEPLTALHAIEQLCGYFSSHGISGIIPRDTASSCKRLCMFLRWMVRDGSLVDLGIWADIIEKRSLIIPLDTHVLTVANELGMITTHSTSMATARRLTAQLAAIFPDDPARGDFALYGYGIHSGESKD